MRLIVSVLGLIVGLSAGACSIPTETFIPLACTMAMCGENATCHEEGSAAVCVCDPGFQDNDNNNSCTPTCDGMACGSKMSCQDSSGTAACVCNFGFQDNDNDGSCTFDCSLAACAVGTTCSDSSGTATCSGCALGYQDKDGDKLCAPSCDNVECGNKGCDDSTGVAVCVCGPGLQDNDNNNSCTPDCSQVTCGTNAACSAASGTATCDCTAGYADFDYDGNCTTTCSANLLNSTLTGGSASIASVAVTGNYGNNVYGYTQCYNRHSAIGILCDHSPTTGSPTKYTNTYPIAGARFYSYSSAGGTGVVVIDAGSAVTFNTLEIFQHFRRQNGTSLFSGVSHMRFSVHASTTTAPAATDAGWVTLTSGFDTLPTPQQTGNVVTKPGIWSGANQTSRFIRVEIQGTQSSRTGIQAVKGFLCQ